MRTAIEFAVALKLFADDGDLMRLNSLTGEQNQRMRWIADHVDELRGVDLACFCSLQSKCHADLLIKYANQSVAE